MRLFFYREAFIVAKNFGLINLGVSPGAGAYFKPSVQQRLRLAKEGKNVSLAVLEQNMNPIEFKATARNTGAILKIKSAPVPDSLKENNPMNNIQSRFARLVTPSDSAIDKFSEMIRKQLEEKFPLYLERLIQAFSLYDARTLEKFANDSDLLFEAAFAEIKQMIRTPTE